MTAAAARREEARRLWKDKLTRKRIRRTSRMRQLVAIVIFRKPSVVILFAEPAARFRSGFGSPPAAAPDAACPTWMTGRRPAHRYNSRTKQESRRHETEPESQAPDATLHAGGQGLVGRLRAQHGRSHFLLHGVLAGAA